MKFCITVTLVLMALVVNQSLGFDPSTFFDCDDVYKYVSTVSGVHTIKHTKKPVRAYCDMDTDGGKWTVIQKRMDGTVNFYRPWDHYKKGFGNVTGEYWLGLDSIHLIAQGKKYELRVDMEDFEGNKAFAWYSSFSVDSEADSYKLHVAGFKDGGAGDSLSYHNGDKFSTFDEDQDSPENCAQRYMGGFWYYQCHSANPNGVYIWGKKPNSVGVIWFTWKGHNYSLKAIEMKIRPVTATSETTTP